jgi:exopolysaccharide biosynthesis polyprenyl glycosylphosphotransferase
VIHFVSKRAICLIALDIIAIFISYLLVLYIRSGSISFNFVDYPTFYVSIVVHTFFLYLFDLYNPFKKFSIQLGLIQEIIFSVCLSSMILASISYLDRTLIMPRITFVFLSISLMALIVFNRIFYNYLFKSRVINKKVIVIGSGELALQIINIVHTTSNAGLDLVGCIGSVDLEKNQNRNIKYLGDYSRLVSLLDWYVVDMVVLALDPADGIAESEIIPSLYTTKKTFISAADLIEALANRIPYELFTEDLILGLAYQLQHKYYLRIKRISDIFLATSLLLLFSPIAFITAGMLSVYSGSSKVFFFQTRIGKGGIPFMMYKFRSMRTQPNGDMRITKIGRWMRKYRIDEIPQLVNIIKGDMSLIGPRPETDYFADLCQKHIPLYMVISELKPGLTGWAQIKLSHVTSVEDYKAKFSYNLYYLKNISFVLDLEIIISTIRTVLLGKGK